jgi:hypothetical protein
MDVSINSSAAVALDLTTIMAAVLVTVTPLKGALELVIPPGARAHDAAVQLMALMLGVGWAFLFIWAEGGLTRSQELQVVIGVLLGIGGGSAGIGAFHIAKSLQSPSADEESATEDTTTTVTTTKTKTAGKKPVTTQTEHTDEPGQPPAP